MKKILLIGAGQIGSRHLQGMIKANEKLNITVVDLSPENLIIAKKRSEEVLSSKKHNITFSSTPPKNEDFYLCVVATNAGVRFNAAKEAIENNKINYMIFEKVLFQKENDYQKMKSILEKEQIRAWVNCPRRYFEGYNHLKKLLRDRKNNNFNMKVSGNDWGMACNSIHFIDIFSYLTNNNSIKIKNYDLNKNIEESKRAGNLEFYGDIEVENCNNEKLVLNCIKTTSSDIKINIEINTDSHKVIINEQMNNINIIHNEKEEKQVMGCKYQGELSGLYIEDLIQKEGLDLTPFEESMELHLPFLRVSLEHINKISNKNYDYCPIT
jgi:hypothetical protein